MAEKPYKFYDRRGASAGGGGSNRLIPAANTSYDRKQIPNLQFDFHRNISATGLARARDVSRYLFWKYPMVQGALLEQANLSVSHFAPQFAGADQDWGDEATAMLLDYSDMFDVRGWPNDEDSYLHNLIIHTRLDGTYWTLLTESSNGFPMIQVIPAHRIGGLIDETTVSINDPFSPPTYDGEPYTGTANPWAGSRVIAGNIVNEYGAAQAYRLYDDPPSTFRDISAQSLFPTYFAMQPDQLVGIPSLATCAADFQDIGETRDFEKLAQKAAARITLIETNEAGEAPPGAQLLTAGSSGSANATGGLYSEVLEGGVYHYLKAGTDSSIATLVADRPSANQQNYEDRILRGCFYAIDWSLDFTLKPDGTGGAMTRVIVEKIKRTVAKNQKLAAKAMRRICGYRISKFIKLGMLRPNSEWYKWEFQGPADVTSDRKYESEIDLKEAQVGWLTDEDAIESRGRSSRVVKVKKERETVAKWEMAQRIAKQFGLTIQEAYFSICQTIPNAPAAVAQPQDTTQDNPQDE